MPQAECRLSPQPSLKTGRYLSHGYRVHAERVKVSGHSQPTGQTSFPPCTHWVPEFLEPVVLAITGGTYCVLSGVRDQGQIPTFAKGAFSWEDTNKQANR